MGRFWTSKRPVSTGRARGTDAGEQWAERRGHRAAERERESVSNPLVGSPVIVAWPMAQGEYIELHRKRYGRKLPAPAQHHEE